MEDRMLYPHVTELKRLGTPPRQPFPRSQRELVELSLRLNPARTARPTVTREGRHGIFR
jgi:hypothetical protein